VNVLDQRINREDHGSGPDPYHGAVLPRPHHDPTIAGQPWEHTRQEPEFADVGDGPR